MHNSSGIWYARRWNASGSCSTSSEVLSDAEPDEQVLGKWRDAAKEAFVTRRDVDRDAHSIRTNESQRAIIRKDVIWTVDR